MKEAILFLLRHPHHWDGGNVLRWSHPVFLLHLCALFFSEKKKEKKE